MIEHFEEQGAFCHWVLMPTAFNAHRENPDFSIIQRYDRETVEDIPAGKRASGPKAIFINRHLMGRAFSEDVSARLSTLRQEFMPK